MTYLIDSGNTSCNDFTAMLSSISPGKIRFDESMELTKICCPVDGEYEFVQNLKKGESYSITNEGKTLHLIQDDIDILRLTKIKNRPVKNRRI